MRNFKKISFYSVENGWGLPKLQKFACHMDFCRYASISLLYPFYKRKALTMKLSLISLLFILTLGLNAQINPELLVNIHSVSDVDMNAISPAEDGVLIYNTDSMMIYVYDGSQWVTLEALTRVESDMNNNILFTNERGDIDTIKIVSDDVNNILVKGSDGGALLTSQQQVYTGFFLLNRNGNIRVNGIPFQPSQVTFVAHANVESLNLNSDNGVGINDNGIANAFGSMNGFARDDGGSITQQVIYVGGSGNSINDISRYASSSNCIGVRYSNQNGNQVGLTTASLFSFNSDGFTVRVNNRSDNLLVLYTAYR